uniref:Uncharacterized protein n=1 Tax=Myoviridae sp. ctZiv5 TaxID=2827289 RepID=A0A8S5R5L9_9CAUD|nr:MAG TPA: hypothetical protein [Myoviridae sp. ctZiv5]
MNIWYSIKCEERKREKSPCAFLFPHNGVLIMALRLLPIVR